MAETERVEEAKARLAQMLREKLPLLKGSTNEHAQRISRAVRISGLKGLMDTPNYWLWCLEQVQ
jgi:hypothetical protein